MQKIIAFLMALIMSLFGLAPAVEPADAYTQAEWYAKVVEAFGLTYDLDDGDNYGKLDAEDPNFEVVEACYDWDVLVGEFDADAAVTDVIVGISLAAAAGLEGASESTEKGIKIAVDAGFVSVKVNLFGKYKEAVISKDDADIALAVAKKAYNQRLRDVDNGEVIADKENDIIDVNGMSEEELLAIQDEIDYISYEGSAKPFATNAAGEFEDQSILDKLNISKTFGNYTIKAKAQSTGFDISVEGNFKGVGISKKYEVRNFEITTKFDGSLAEKQINEAYLLMDYDLNDITTISGSYAASLAEKEYEDGSTQHDVLQKIHDGMYEFESGTAAEIPVFSYDVPIPNCPAITVGVTAKIVIKASGYVQLILSSSETKGVEIVNNKVRLINESEGEKTTLNAQARLEATITIFGTVKCVSICLIDIDITAGLGIVVTLHGTSDAGDYTFAMPFDFLTSVDVVYPTFQNFTAVGNVKMYGILSIGIGNNSILSKIGLKKTWNIFNESNGTFLDKDFDIVKAAA